MNLDPGIICYEHCDLGRLFAFSLPSSCTLCRADLTVEPLALPPFRLPFPFTRANQTPCCVVIKPTKGDFLHDYRNTLDLHIGVTDSEGCVFEYDFEGLHSDYTSSWSQCLAVPVLSNSVSVKPDPVWKEYWDFTLHSITQENWTENRYNEESYNCYTFVINFLKALRPPTICIKSLNKTNFCSSFIVPHTSAAARYISVYRSLLKQDVVSVTKPQRKEKEKAVSNGGLTTTIC